MDTSHPVSVAELAPGSFVLAGEFDIASVAEVRERLLRANGDLSIDCSGVTFVDAAGLGVFVALHRQCEERGARLVIVDPSSPMWRLLGLTALLEVLHISEGGSADAP
jgi:anti-sigma B factor antagonist